MGIDIYNANFVNSSKFHVFFPNDDWCNHEKQKQIQPLEWKFFYIVFFLHVQSFSFHGRKKSLELIIEETDRYLVFNTSACSCALKLDVLMKQFNYEKKIINFFIKKKWFFFCNNYVFSFLQFFPGIRIQKIAVCAFSLK
jgi:hypothetical protein